MPDKIIHEGQNLKRFREMMGYTQDTFASIMGDDWTQKKISMLEAKEIIEPQTLEEVARALKVSPEAIKNFDEKTAIHIIASNNNGKDNSAAVNFQCTFNPLEKYVEQVEENKKLYERLLQEKETMIEELKKLLNK